MAIEDSLSHFVVFYGFKSNKPIVEIPPSVNTYSKELLNEIWKSKSLHSLVSNSTFVKKNEVDAEKKKWIIEPIKDDVHLVLIAFLWVF